MCQEGGGRMISVNDLTVSFGGEELLDRIGFSISEGEKIGLTGKNGCGKSTLLKVICGRQAPTSGCVEKPSDLKIGYLPQIMSHEKSRTVMDEVLTVFRERFDLEEELSGIHKQLEKRTDYESESYSKLIERMNHLADRLSLEGSEPPEVKAGKILKGLGFESSDFSKQTGTFSQGWNMRIELAKILLSAPGLMLLDEPTNHLDIESIEWLERYLKGYPGALILVSHDRRFLDNITTRTIEISLGHAYDYKVPYSKYLELRQERLRQQMASYENQQRMIEKTEAFIERFRYKATKSNQVQSRIKAIDRLERIEVDEVDTSSLAFRFPPASRTGDVVYKAVNLSAGYPGKIVFEGADIEIKRGEKVAFVGRNGEGKTTELKVIVGELSPVAGESQLGHNVHFGYYAQNQEDVLDKQDTVYGTLDKVATGDIRTKLRDLLAQFLFRGDDIDKKVAVLSGGERARLGMAKLMLGSFNCLLLDEPTNHMDIRSKEMLKKALSAYDGTLIVVSHDRDFLDGLVDKLYVFRDGRVKSYLGDVNDFLDSLKIDSLNELERSGSRNNKNEAPAKPAKDDYKASKVARGEEKKLRNRFDYLEKEIDKLTARMKSIEALLSAPGPSDDIMELTREYLELKRDVDAKTTEWEQILERITL